MGSTSGTTIAAIASPPGPGERGVLRLSGPRSAELVRATCSQGGALLENLERGAHDVRFDDGRGTQPALLFWMPGPRSFTREDVAELHLPGAPPLLAAALERLLALGATPAGPGEFTRRAFLNGRIDLTRAEGVLALVSARDAGERRAATALLFGGLGDRMTALRDALDGLRSLCEASLDFDETDTGHVPEEELARGAEEVARGLAEALTWEERRTPFAGAAEIVLAGEPNAGKSRLFNRLTAGRALVSDHAGTTRDALSGEWLLAGIPCRLIDTAGLDAAAAGPDERAQELAGGARAAADLVLWVVDATSGEGAPEAPVEGRITVWNKTDQLDAAALARLPESAHDVRVSAATGEGIVALTARAGACLGLSPDAAGGGARGLRRELDARHRRALEAGRDELQAGLESLAAGQPLDLFAEALRSATAELDGITGRTTPEDLLDRIFASFCIGK